MVEAKVEAEAHDAEVHEAGPTMPVHTATWLGHHQFLSQGGPTHEGRAGRNLREACQILEREREEARAQILRAKRTSTFRSSGKTRSRILLESPRDAERPRDVAGGGIVTRSLGRGGGSAPLIGRLSARSSSSSGASSAVLPRRCSLGHFVVHVQLRA